MMSDACATMRAVMTFSWKGMSRRYRYTPVPARTAPHTPGVREGGTAMTDGVKGRQVQVSAACSMRVRDFPLYRQRRVS